ncbi:integrase catalytic domain-containing protein [Bradyrhizobium barranii]
MAGKISMGARREVVSVVTERYRSAKRAEKGRILDELCATTGWHRKHAVRALRRREAVGPGEVEATRKRRRRYGATIKDALTALWEASDRVCGKRLKVMIPTLLPALERHGRLQLGQSDRDRVLAISAATIDRLLVDVKIAASGGRRRRAGFHSAIRREVPIRTFNDWNSPPPGFCEVDMVAHGGTSVAGSFIQTLTMVDIATGWTECLPLLTRDGSLVAEAINRAQSLFPWLLRGVDFDNDSAFMNDVVVPWCRQQKLEVTRSRAYKKNDQAFVEQKNGAVVRRLMGYGRFDGVETARMMGRLYAAARLYVNFFQPSFKLKEKRREGAKVIKRYHARVDALSARAGPSQGDRGCKAAATRSVSLARSGRAVGRDSRNPGRTRQSRRSSCRTGALPATRLHEHRAGDRGDVCEDARQDGDGRRAACHAPAKPSAL